MKTISVRSLRLAWFVLIAAVCFCSIPAVAATTQTDPEENTLEPAAMEALDTMSRFLRTLPAFEVQSTFYRDEVLLSGQKILVSGTSSMTVKLPDKLYTQVKVDEKQRDFAMYFDGQTLTLYGRNNQFYVSTPAPGTLKDLALKTFVEKGIEIPLQDLFLWGTDEADQDVITTAVTIAETTLDDKPCTHYAYRQADVDWQIWIQAGKQPLPLQLVITTTTESSQPQYAARLRWNLKPTLSEDLFVFTPPKGAHAIDFMPSPKHQKENAEGSQN
ncbi:DUF2092 domain-containing protein [uncultured Desulfosarcina sp.]|uniref:DUF2092 domain-containing protein n=1 Tax=uncultured Desulfosarcina sp. TaxID=218289 RepID=UPI0029C6BCD4|nr:DUF2092 domain-containing protein [uncultured Desulfosarcina sp.]